MLELALAATVGAVGITALNLLERVRWHWCWTWGRLGDTISKDGGVLPTSKQIGNANNVKLRVACAIVREWGVIT